MVIRQSKSERVPARPFVILMVFLVALALAIVAVTAPKSTAPAQTHRGPAVVQSSNLPPDALERNTQILQSQSAQHPKKLTVQ